MLIGCHRLFSYSQPDNGYLSQTADFLLETSAYRYLKPELAPINRNSVHLANFRELLADTLENEIFRYHPQGAHPVTHRQSYL